MLLWIFYLKKKDIEFKIINKYISYQKVNTKQQTLIQFIRCSETNVHNVK